MKKFVLLTDGGNKIAIPLKKIYVACLKFQDGTWDFDIYTKRSKFDFSTPESWQCLTSILEYFPKWFIKLTDNTIDEENISLSSCIYINRCKIESIVDNNGCYEVKMTNSSTPIIISGNQFTQLMQIVEKSHASLFEYITDEKEVVLTEADKLDKMMEKHEKLEKMHKKIAEKLEKQVMKITEKQKTMQEEQK